MSYGPLYYYVGVQSLKYKKVSMNLYELFYDELAYIQLAHAPDSLCMCASTTLGITDGV